MRTFLSLGDTVAKENQSESDGNIDGQAVLLSISSTDKTKSFQGIVMFGTLI